MLLLNIYVRLFSVEGHQGQAVIITLLLSLHRIHMCLSIYLSVSLQQYKVPSFSGIRAFLTIGGF